MRTLGSVSLCRSLDHGRTGGSLPGCRLPGRHRCDRPRSDLRRISRHQADLVESRTFDGGLQLLEYVPTVLDGPAGYHGSGELSEATDCAATRLGDISETYSGVTPPPGRARKRGPLATGDGWSRPGFEPRTLRITNPKRGVRRVIALRGRVRGRVQGSAIAQCVGCSQLATARLSADVCFEVSLGANTLRMHVGADPRASCRRAAAALGLLSITGGINVEAFSIGRVMPAACRGTRVCRLDGAGGVRPQPD